MAATLIDGRAVAAKVRARAAEDARELGRLGLATILVGDDPASHIYIASKHKAAAEAGFDPIDIRLPAETSEEEVLSRVAELNEDDGVDGILVQMPVPEQIDPEKVQAAVAPVKDVDGFHPLNAGLLYLGRPTLVPATPLGIMTLLGEYRVPLAGARAVVIGRSPIVGRAMALLLMHENATVTVCHSRTVDLHRHTLEADVLVAAVGVPGIVSPEMVKPRATVIDVGQNKTDAGLVGDVDAGAAEVAGLVTPVPGGVGPMTIATLLANTVKAARFRRGLEPFPAVV